MSAYSDWKCGALSDEKFAASMRRECYDRIYPDASPEDYRHYTCHDCEYCKSGKRFVWDIVTRKADGKEVLKKTKNYAYMDVCVRDIENIKEINTYDDVCEDHGLLFWEDD